MNSGLQKSLSTALAAFGLLFPLFSKKIFGRRKIAERVSVVVADLVPVVGLAFLGWSPLEVLFYYFLELSIYLFFHSLSATIAPFFIFWHRLKVYRWYERLVFYPFTWPPALLTAVAPVLAGLMFLFLLTPVYKVIHFLADRSDQSMVLLSLEKRYTEFNFTLDSSFFMSTEFLLIIAIGLYFLTFLGRDHLKDFSIVVGDLFEDDNIIILLFWGPMRALVDRAPLLLIAFFVTVILGAAIYVLPGLLFIVIGLRISLQLYLVAVELQGSEMPTRIKTINVQNLAEFQDRLVYGFVFGYQRKLALEQAQRSP